MNRHLTRLLLALYPRAYRDRYGAEVVRLTEELIRAGETTPARGALDMAAAALAERGRALAESRRVALAMTIAALVAVAGSFYATSPARTPAAASAPSAASAPRAGAILVRFACTVTVRAGGARPAGQSRVPVPAKVTPCLFRYGSCHPGPVRLRSGVLQVTMKSGQCVWYRPAVTARKPASPGP